MKFFISSLSTSNMAGGVVPCSLDLSETDVVLCSGLGKTAEGSGSPLFVQCILVFSIRFPDL